MQVGKLILCGLVLSALFGCGGGDGDSSDSSGSSGGGGPTTYTISGELFNSSGGVHVYDQDNHTIGDLADDGKFTLSKTYQKGDYFKLSVTPKSPSVDCALSIEEGTILANITDLAIECTPASTRLEMVPEIFAILPNDANSLYLSFQVDPNIGQSSEYSIYVAEGATTVITDEHHYQTVKGGNGEVLVTGLTADTTYQFKVIARNGNKVLESQQQTFELTPPPILVDNALNISSSLLDYEYDEGNGTLTIRDPSAVVSTYSHVTSKNTNASQQSLLLDADELFQELKNAGVNAIIVTSDGVYQVLGSVIKLRTYIYFQVAKIAAEKIIKEGTFSFKYRFTPGQVEVPSQLGLSPRLSNQTTSIQNSDTSDLIHVTPEMTYDVVYESRLHIADETVQPDSFVSIHGDYGVDITVELGLKDEAKWEPDDITISPFGRTKTILVVGYIPVLLSYEPKIKVSRMATAEGTLAARHVSSVYVPFDLRVTYDGDFLEPAFDLSKPVFQSEFQDVKAEGSAHAEVALEFGMGFEVYASTELDAYVGRRADFDASGSVFVVSSPNSTTVETSLDQLDLTSSFTCLMHAGFKWVDGLEMDAEFCDIELSTVRKQPELKAIGGSEFVVGETFDLLIEVEDGDGGNNVAPTPEFVRWASNSDAIIDVDPNNSFSASITPQEEGEQSLFFFAKGSQIDVEKVLEIPIQVGTSVCPSEQRIKNDSSAWPESEITMVEGNDDCHVSFTSTYDRYVEMYYRDHRLDEMNIYYPMSETEGKLIVSSTYYYTVLENVPEGHIDYALSKRVDFNLDGSKLLETNMSAVTYDYRSDRWNTLDDGARIYYDSSFANGKSLEINFRPYKVGDIYRTARVGNYVEYYSTGDIKQKIVYGDPHLYTTPSGIEQIHEIITGREHYYQTGDSIWGHTIYTYETRIGDYDTRYSALTQSMTYVHNNIEQETYYGTVHDAGRHFEFYYPTYTTLYDYETGDVDATFEYEEFVGSLPYREDGRSLLSRNFDDTLLDEWSRNNHRPYPIHNDLEYAQVRNRHPIRVTNGVLHKYDENQERFYEYAGSYLVRAIDYTGGLAHDRKPYREIEFQVAHGKEASYLIQKWSRTDIESNVLEDVGSRDPIDDSRSQIVSPTFHYREMTYEADTTLDKPRGGDTGMYASIATQAYTAEGQLKHTYSEVAVDETNSFELHGTVVTTADGKEPCAWYNFERGLRSGLWEYNRCFLEQTLKYKKANFIDDKVNGLLVVQTEATGGKNDLQLTYEAGVLHGPSRYVDINYANDHSWSQTVISTGSYENNQQKGWWIYTTKKPGEEDSIRRWYFE